MGYRMEQRKACFMIEHNNFDKVLEAIWAIPVGAGDGYAWVDMSYRNTDSLVMAMKAWRWDVYFDRDNVLNDITEIHFAGEKCGDDEVLFRAIAPYVASGSYIEMQGEDGKVWRWVFKDGQFKEVGSKVVWEE